MRIFTVVVAICFGLLAGVFFSASEWVLAGWGNWIAIGLLVVAIASAYLSLFFLNDRKKYSARQMVAVVLSSFVLLVLASRLMGLSVKNKIFECPSGLSGALLKGVVGFVSDENYLKDAFYTLNDVCRIKRLAAILEKDRSAVCTTANESSSVACVDRMYQELTAVSPLSFTGHTLFVLNAISLVRHDHQSQDEPKYLALLDIASIVEKDFNAISAGEIRGGKVGFEQKILDGSRKKLIKLVEAARRDFDSSRGRLKDQKADEQEARLISLEKRLSITP